MAAETFPLPPALAAEIEATLRDDDMAMLTSRARYLVRRMIATAYGQGHEDGRIVQAHAEATDRIAIAALVKKSGGHGATRTGDSNG